MTTQTIQKKIARAIELKQIVANLEVELKQIKSDLAAEASYRTGEQEPTEGGGWSWRFLDHDDNQVCVTQPAPKLKSTIDPEAKGYDKIKEAAGRAWSLLFFQKPAYGLVDDFKNKVHLHLGGRDAVKLIKLVTSESSIKVSFEVAGSEAQ